MPYVRAKASDIDRAQELTVQSYAALDSYSWETLQRLARLHESGRLSLDSWQTASGAIAQDALKRVEREGRIDFGAVASG